MQNLKEKKYWIWLSLIKELGSVRKQKLLEKYKTPLQIYLATKRDLLKVEGIGEKVVENILQSKDNNLLEYHIRYMEKNNINIISIDDEEYPKILKEIYDPPISLYVKGETQNLKENNIAIVGCRDCTEYGKKSAKYFSYNLSRNGINIVSGLARGIDSYAHYGSICAKNVTKSEQKNLESGELIQKCGKTIAVLGNGLNTIYPKENQIIADEIIRSGGTIITEYPCGTKPEKMNFPARNRIISGLCKGIIVVEAKEKSGTLITVDFALEQGRDVYVVPGNINSINSVGTNELIKQGAKIVTSYLDIV